MPLQNRVLPNGQIVALPARGTFTGNRGIIHRDDKTLGTARWSHHAWICCTLDWQGRKRSVMTGRNWTELFFLDEATALAAGHRPCGYCRRPDYNRFVDAWETTTGTRPSAKVMDKTLHPARVRRDRSQVTYKEQMTVLPDFTMIDQDGQPHVILGHRLLPYTPDGYGPPIPRPRCGNTTVLTPRPMVAVLKAGYTPLCHKSAQA